MGGFGKRTGGGRRAALREAAPIAVVISTVTHSHTVELVDISVTGARLHGNDLPVEGGLVELRVDSLRLFSMVKWVNDCECGIAFERPLMAQSVATVRSLVGLTAGLTAEARAAYDDWTGGFVR